MKSILLASISIAVGILLAAWSVAGAQCDCDGRLVPEPTKLFLPYVAAEYPLQLGPTCTSEACQ